MITPPVETIRISARGREQLIKMKRQTGIENWNVLSRWALCASLAESTEPTEHPDSGGEGVEMAWKVFAGEASDAIAAAITIRHLESIEAGGSEPLADYLRKHIHRGLGYLAAGQPNKSMADFLARRLTRSA